MTNDRPICVYQDFDPDSLQPANEATRRRIDELSILRDNVRGKSVLDIGCNAGLVSLLCARWGAARVTAVDVNEPNVTALATLSRRHDLKIEARVAAFSALTPERDRADVVLMLEVIHWLVAQGHPLKSVIAHLSELTRTMLVIETPWSVDEPSIVQQTKLTAHDYGMDLILQNLLDHFKTVEVVHFSTYFAAAGKSQRVLLVARRLPTGN
jgi:2-polyprenyl-3-methyl-5-hydroxy-6-metoxy-1,4-benzoquinol methylase